MLDCTLVDKNNPIGDFEGLVLVVCDEDGGEPRAVVEFAQPAAEIFADFGVEGTEGFVEQEHLGAVSQSAGKGDPLALSTGELGGQALLVAIELHGGEKFGDAVSDGGFRRTLGASENAKGKCDVLKNIHVVEESVMLKNKACLALVGGEIGDIATVKSDAPVVGIRKFQTGNDTEERCLSRSAGAEEGDEFPFADVEGNLAQAPFQTPCASNSSPKTRSPKRWQ